MTARTNTQQLAYAGRHRLADTVVIALPPAAPMHGRLSRPLRPVPTAPVTAAMPALRLMPPVQLDRRDGWKLTRRGRIVAQSVAGAAILGFAIAADPIAHAVVQFTVSVGQIVGAL